MTTVLVLYGPKAVGKTWLAHILQDRLGIDYVNADEVIPQLVTKGMKPHAEEGWLQQITDAVVAAAEHAEAVSVEATGAWESDWKLAEQLAHEGLRVRRVWIWAPVDQCLARLHARPLPPQVPDEEAKDIHKAATEQAASRSFDLVLDTSRWLLEKDVVTLVHPLLAS